MKLAYTSQAPSLARYADGRLPQSERAGQLPGHGTVRHSTSVDITPRHLVAQFKAAQSERVNKMFAQMKAVENVPVASRGAGGKDVTQSEEYKGLAGMPVSHPDDKTGWFAVEAGSNDKAKKLQAKVNVYARAGAGTFKTRLLKGSDTLYVKRISDTYVPQRGAGSEE